MTKVRDVMTGRVTVVKVDTDVQRICKMLIKNRVSGLPVVDKKERLVGFVSERDIIGAVGSKNFLKKKAKDVMSKKVVSVPEELKVEEVSRIFTEKPYRYLPVTKGGKVAGIISRKDVINRLVGQYY
ncbi:MAG: hypothetical protein AUJ75_03535 [Candidatus Omnitrophica bacterium CG1_02_49_10]|nr:MAG: hypothetical protein AUJ75_03535 [Candidatus Omnitrophica bacterium CG1_02_49_10]